MAKALTHDTPWTVDDALAFLRDQKDSGTQQWKGFCLRLAARAYGYASSNVLDTDSDHDNDVADYWSQARPELKHPGDRRPPVGGLAIFGNPGRFGHIATVVQSGPAGVAVLANDDLDAGRVRPHSLAEIEQGLRLDYLGWVEPHFPRGTPGNPQGLPATDHRRPVFLRALFLGNSDSDSVRLLQRRLNDVQGGDLDVTGTYDALTRKAVAAFQRRACRFEGSGADGLMWDRETQSGGERTAALLFPSRKYDVRRGAVDDSDTHLVSGTDAHAQPAHAGLTLRARPGAAPPDPDEPAPIRPRVELAQLVPGRTNQSVRQLQRRLNHLQDAGLAVSGTYDAETVAAVRAWQISIGDVHDADGVLGPRQFAVLFPHRQFARHGAPLPGALTLSADGEKFIVEFEGFSSKLYNDQAGHCSIGFGHLVHLGHCHTTEGGLENGISRARAMALMRSDAQSTIDSVSSHVTVPVSQEQFDALVSFAFNVGAGNFETSTLLKKLNAGNLGDVPEELKRWNKITVDGRKVASTGLTRRRGREAKLFATGVYTA